MLLEGPGDSQFGGEEWYLMHNEMDFDQRKIGEEEPVAKLLAFLLLPAE